jgi:hypothetical protein
MEMLKIKTFIDFLDEDAAVNNAGGGNVAGVVGDPPVSKKKQIEYQKSNMVLKRKPIEK